MYPLKNMENILDLKKIYILFYFKIDIRMYKTLLQFVTGE